MPTLIRFLLIHAAIGFAIAFVFVGVMLALDVGGMRTLMMASDMGYVALFLIAFMNGLTFASVQMGVAVMLLGEDGGHDGGRGGDHMWNRIWFRVRAWLAPPRKRAMATIPVKHR